MSPNSRYKFIPLPLRSSNAKIHNLNLKNLIFQALVTRFPITDENEGIDSVLSRNDLKLDILSHNIVLRDCTN